MERTLEDEERKKDHCERERERERDKPLGAGVPNPVRTWAVQQEESK